MLISSNKSGYLSGYIQINKSLQIEDISGQIKQILRFENLNLKMDILEIYPGLKKNLRFFFENEVHPAINENKIRHLVFKRKGSILNIAVTPLANGSILLSLEESYQNEIIAEQSVPEQFQEILIRLNYDLKII